MLLPDHKIRLSAPTLFISILLLTLAACTTPPPTEVTSVTITGGDREVGVLETITLTAEVLVQGDADRNVTWASSAESVATINGEGEFSALSVGTSTITASSNFDPAKRGSVEITVTATCRSPERAIEIPDSNLRTAILEALGSEDGIILCEGMRGLTELTATKKEVQELEGLQHAANLTSLNLGKNAISDITPLENLTELTSLNLANTDVSDIAPLENLTKLTNLHLGNAEITDITALGNLVNLTHLYLGWNEISVITPLVNLTSLKDLDLSDNAISDITPLDNHTNLRNVYLGRNCLDITDNSPARSVIATLEAADATVVFDDQRNCGP